MQKFRKKPVVIEAVQITDKTFDDPHPNPEHLKGVIYDPLNQPSPEVMDHPLFPVLVAAIEQAMHGKGERHGGNAAPFLEQPWVHYAKMHGRGFLTGQATKKLEEAAHQREGEAFETEVLGAIVYAGMSVLKERGDA